MVGEIDTGNDISERGSVKGKKETTQDRAAEKLLPSLTLCLRFER